ncbi:alkaline phosphatase family protein [Zunongwangia sp. F260]|uniref:Alkaline phosphatase family protein n=1 Tax=Autumnicola lenta TaxID=3075593 RepID=A0ABU3CP79_9FLAO|nr:alkaline phosphatase family protein [Zunongwangia sp. F260]MDT0648091.1 alkaline phosphatase family protein [Zunongwangia sp. F260]
MKKTVVLNVVALSSRLIGEHTPFLQKWSQKGKRVNVKPLLPAVTCSSQATYFTGKWPAEHGVVGNGWCFLDEYEIKFWRQSNKLVQAPKIWEELKKQDLNFTCANMFWWFNMNSDVDFAVTPRPLYPATGLKLPDIHSQPMDLRQKLQSELGQFPLFSFWGPNANIESTRWIADASMLVDKWHDPTLTLIYLPHLDYNLQRVGIDFSKMGKDLQEIDRVCEDLITYYEGQGAEVIIVSEYGITDVNNPVHVNRVLRENGYLAVKDELGRETMDTWASRAFAVADHQIAHIYIKDSNDIMPVKELLENTSGIEFVLDKKAQENYHLNHERSGDLVVMADEKSWFTYYFWLDDNKAPDYARTVDIHRKPGYDPVETFADPNISFLKAKIGLTLIKKKLGFRYLMDVIPLDATLVKGSHGRLTKEKEDWPLFITQNSGFFKESVVEPTDVYDLIVKHLTQ